MKYYFLHYLWSAIHQVWVEPSQERGSQPPALQRDVATAAYPGGQLSLSQYIIRKCLGLQDIMEEWAEHFKMCQLIFYRATSGNKKVLFGAKGSVIEKNDERLRTIPFQTRRATFKEVKRIHEMLCRVEILGNASDVINVISNYVNLSFIL